jgi:hypothetical protein
MSYIVETKVTINGLVYRVPSLSIEEGYMFTPIIAKFDLPRNLKVQTTTGPKLKKTSDLLKKGDTVKIEIGFLPKTFIAFEGYVYLINYGQSLSIECWDASYCLTQFSLSYSSETATLTDLFAKMKAKAGIKWLYKSVKFHISTTLGKLRIDRATGEQVLDTLRNSYGIDTWSRDGVLHVGAAYVASLRKTHTLDFGRHIIDESNLQYVDQPQPTQVTATGFTNNQKFTVKVGTDGGQNRQIFRYGVNEAQLKAEAEQELARASVSGYEGTLEAFAWPYTRHGDIANLIDSTNSQRDGSYAISKRTFNASVQKGLTQVITLDGIR